MAATAGLTAIPAPQGCQVTSCPQTRATDRMASLRGICLRSSVTGVSGNGSRTTIRGGPAGPANCRSRSQASAGCSPSIFKRGLRVVAALVLTRSIESLKKHHPELPHEVVRMPAGSELSCKSAMLDVTPDEVAFYRTLTWVRRFGQAGPESIVNPPAGKSLIETAVRTTFRRLAEVPNREFVLGGFVVAPPGARSRKWTRETFAGLEEPGFAKVAMNFRVEPQGADASILTTETRIYATDASTRRAFKVYWRTIYPGSALIRVTWLRAIKKRASPSCERRKH